MVDAPEPGTDGRKLRVLSVFTSAEQRSHVHTVCRGLVPGSHCVDTASVTDAVLALLTRPVDLVLVDTDAAGDLLAGLVLHLRRSAPRAGLLGFHTDGAVRAAGEGSAPSAFHPWTAMPQVVAEWVRRWQLGEQVGIAGTGSVAPPRAEA